MAGSAQNLTPDWLKALKVLAVDPNPYLLTVVTDSVRRLGTTNPAAAASAKEAFKTGGELCPDIIFVDWDAGGMSALEFIREIRQNSTSIPRDTPIVLMSSTIDRDQLMTGRQAGMNEFLLKPVSAKNVLSRIEQIVLRPRRFIVSTKYVGPCRRRIEDTAYAGPLRRLTDEQSADAVAEKANEQAKKNVFKLRAIIQKLSSYADRTNVERSVGIRGMFELLKQHADEVATLGDDTIIQVWNLALRYVEGVGSTPAYDIDVVKYHFQTIATILDLPEEALDHRAAVASELDRLVTKKMNAASRKPAAA